MGGVAIMDPELMNTQISVSLKRTISSGATPDMSNVRPLMVGAFCGWTLKKLHPVLGGFKAFS